MSESREAYQRRLERQRKINRRLRASETPEKRARRLAVQKLWDQSRRATETDDERRRRLAADRESHKRWHEKLSDEEKSVIARKKGERAARIRSEESSEQREQRLLRQREHTRKSRERRTEAQREVAAIKNREYRDRNRSSLAAKRRERFARDAATRIKARLRSRIHRAVAAGGARKKAKTMELVGIAESELMMWIEGQFLDGMSWENRREWHIDHIIPCSAFDLTDEEQQRVAFHYTNLRPLWGTENMAKRDRLPVPPRATWTLDCIQEARRALGVAMHVAEPA